MTDMKDLPALQEELKESRRIVITTHSRPDGDAMGSSLGLYNVLRQLGHRVTVVAPTPFDHFLGWLPGSEHVLVHTHQTEQSEKAFAEAELLFCLDFGASHRIDGLGQHLLDSPAKKILVDHHIAPEDFPDLMFHRVTASSTAEIVYQLIENMGHLNLIGAAEAECLYTGIMTDTGSFRFSNTTPEVHFIVANLLARGIEVGRIHNRLFDNFTETRMRFIGFCLMEKLTILPEYHTAYMAVTQEEIEKYKVKGGDTEGLVNYNLSIKGINFGVLIIDRGDKVKLSFRSIGQFPCNEFAGNFGGGGHHNASGGATTESLEATEKKFLSLLEQFKDRLSY